MITFPYVRGEIKNLVYWGTTTNLGTLDPFEGTVYNLFVGNPILLNWASIFNTGYASVYCYVAIPQRTPDFPNYTHFANTSVTTDYRVLSAIYTETNILNDLIPYKLYVSLLGAAMDVTFKQI